MDDASWEAIAARRMARQGLSAPLGGADAVAEAVRRMCGAHAQVQSAAEHSVARRLSGVSRTDVHRALWVDRVLVRTYGPRGTVHLLPAEDLPRHLARWLATEETWTRHAWEEAGVAKADDAPAPQREPPVAVLLPDFDAYVVAAQPRERLFAGRAFTRALAGTQAGNFPVVLVRGVVGGVWHGKRTGRRIAVTVEPLVRMTKALRGALGDEVSLLGEILQLKAELTIGDVAIGAHA